MTTHDEIVNICVDGENIGGTLVAPRTLVPGVLFVHGWGGCQQQYVARAREAAALGCVCLTFDLRGHMKTKSQYETVSRADNLGDVVAAYDVLAGQRGVDPSRLAVIGSSYGGYLAAILSSIRPVRWLALRVPALYRDSDWDTPKHQLKQRQNLDAYRRETVRPGESRALLACTMFEGDVLIVESEHDRVVPAPVIANYRAACTRARSVTYRLMEGADHGLSKDVDQRAYTSILTAWLKRVIAREAAATDSAARARSVEAVAAVG